MAWSGGNFTRANPTWATDASLGIGIEAGRHDAQDNDFTAGIDQCLNKTGQNSMTGDLNLGGYRPTNVAAGTAAAPAICAGNDVNTGIFGPAADTLAVATNGTERMRIDSTGRVGIGTTNPSSLLALSGTASAITHARFSADGSGSVIELRKSRSATVDTNTIVQGGDVTGVIAFSGGNGTGYDPTAYIISRVDATPGASNDMPGRLEFLTTPDASATPAERMRIDSNGRVGIGMTAYSNIRTCIRGTDATSSNFAFYCENTTPTELFAIRNDGRFQTGVAASSPYNLTSGAAANLLVDVNGFLYRSTSSQKYKTDIKDYNRGLDAVDSLRPVFYKGINDGNTQFAGLIAEEVHAAGLYEFVVYNSNNEPDALHYGNMVTLAFKAIQELNAKVEALEAKVENLEAVTAGL